MRLKESQFEFADLEKKDLGRELDEESLEGQIESSLV